MPKFYMEADRADVAKLQKLFKATEKYTRKKTGDMIKQTMIWATESAANATKPRKSRDNRGNVRGGKLAQKHLFRPLVPMPPSMGYWYTKKDSQRKRPFRLDKELKRGELTRQGLIRVKKAILVHNKKGKSYIPYAGTKINKKDKRFHIPFAGLAKQGWWRAVANLSPKMRGKGIFLKRNKKAHGISKIKKGILSLEVWNTVSYVSKSSPGAARYGLKRATNRMRKVYMPKVDKAIEKRFNRAAI